MKKEISTTKDGNLIIPQFFKKNNVLFIPRKLHKSINFIDETLLVKIHKDINIAKELCLLFLSYLTRTVFEGEDTYNGIRLNAKILSELLCSAKLNKEKTKTSDTNVYQRIIEALVIGTPDKGGIILVDNHYITGKESRKYNLTDTYKCGIQSYTLKTKHVKDIVYRNLMLLWIKTNTSIIAKNEIIFYTQLDLPTKEELLEKGKELCNNNYITKKGNKLTMLYRKPKTYWKDANERSFVENDIEMFEYYTSSGYMIPIIGQDYCPRVYDSISLLPGWIRNEIKCNGERLFEVDYKCLHPNIIMNIYNEPIKYLTHDIVAEKLNIKKSIVKKLHLSFFNMEIKHLTSSKLMEFYSIVLIEKIIKDKKEQGDHRITSKLLFNLEKQIMEKAIFKLNNLNIYVGYIYDALLTTLDNIEIVKKIMEETVLEFNVYTTVDSNEPKIETNSNTLETKIITTEETKTIKELITKETYKEIIEITYAKIYQYRWYKENMKEIYNILYESQTKNKTKIENILKQFNK